MSFKTVLWETQLLLGEMGTRMIPTQINSTQKSVFLIFCTYKGSSKFSLQQKTSQLNNKFEN